MKPMTRARQLAGFSAWRPLLSRYPISKLYGDKIRAHLVCRNLLDTARSAKPTTHKVGAGTYGCNEKRSTEVLMEASTRSITFVL